MSKLTKRLIRIAAGGLALTAGIIIKPDNRWVELGLFLAGYMAAGGDVLWKALRSIGRGGIFDENFLMSAATAGAFAIGQYHEGIGVMLFYQVGELFQDIAVGKARKSIGKLMDIRPDFANVKRGAEIIKTDPADVRPDDVIIVRPGEKIPLDGVVAEGYSTLDTSALTGEPVPKETGPGSEVSSGCVNLNGLLTVRVTKEYGESAVSKILDLVENAASKKAKTENFITKFAKRYTPAVIIAAALISLLPPLFSQSADLSAWVYRGLTFLVISCPCALVISIPLSFFGGVGGASRRGILIKGGNYLEILSGLETVVFDKTGTLTKGAFNVQRINAEGMSESELLELAAYAENYSTHPISASLKRAYGKEIDAGRISEAEEIPGRGVRAVIDGRTVFAGNEKLMRELNIERGHTDLAGTVVFVAADGARLGSVVIADEIKEDSARAVEMLRETGVRRMVMLTGDGKEAGETTARELGLDAVFTELLPDAKAARLEEELARIRGRGKLAFVGDGINDAPVLARADVGVAMGGLGSDAAIEAADVVIMTDEPSKIVLAVRIAKKTMGIAKENIAFTLAVKFTVMILAAAGAASMWAGVAADAGVAVLAVLNAARALNTSRL